MRQRSLVAFRREPGWHGIRCYVLGRRLHHGMAGLLATTFGVIAMVSDRHDFPWVRHA